MAETTVERLAATVFRRLTDGSIIREDKPVTYDDKAIEWQVGNDSYWNVQPATDLWRIVTEEIDTILRHNAGWAMLGRLIGTMPFRAAPIDVCDRQSSPYESITESFVNLAKQAVVAVIAKQINERRQAQKLVA